MIMKKLWIVLLALIAFSSVRADEGMWMLPLLQQQKLSQMQALGLRIQASDIYNTDGSSLKDAVVHFGTGCTGEIISSQGLVLTNYHCGYSAIQSHSSTQHDYLTSGFWAASRQQELANPGLTVTLVKAIDDVTDYVKAALQRDEDSTAVLFLSSRYLNRLAVQKVGQETLISHPGMGVEIRPFFGGNRYYMFTTLTYRDVRLVGAPPSAIGKFGGETDNWSWPRQTCDFSLFRIYADAQGNPADYAESNVPLHPERWFPISLNGINENDFVMMIGFPGRTNRYFTPWEVAEKRDVDNAVVIAMRELRQNTLLEEMHNDPAVRIQYASKYASSANGYKRAKGSNRAIDTYHLIDLKNQEKDRLLAYGSSQGKPEYAEAVTLIEQIVSDRHDLALRRSLLQEAILNSVEFSSVPMPLDLQPVIAALEGKNADERKHQLQLLEGAYHRFADKNYSSAVDCHVAKVMIKAYRSRVVPRMQPTAFAVIDKKFHGDVDKYVDFLFHKSIFGSAANFRRFMAHPKAKTLRNDPMIVFASSVRDMRKSLDEAIRSFEGDYEEADRTYIRGIMEMEGENNLFPDANSTMRFAYGKVTGFSPNDSVHYVPFSTLDEVIRKENPDNNDFIVPARLKELYQKKDFGRYAAGDGKLHACFLANTHSTGGNSGSPVFNGDGKLVGINFDRTWEGVGGDILYNADQQRSIIVDIRYILFIIDKYADSKYIVDEMTLE